MNIIKNKIKSYIFFTFLISWLLWLPGILQSFSLIDLSNKLTFSLGMIGTIIPSVIGLILLINEKQLKKALIDLFRFRLDLWIILSILILPLAIIITHIINIFFLKGTVPIITETYKIPFQFIIILIIAGPLGEEIGWRGFLQSKIKEKYLSVITGLIVGLIWAIWHLPIFLIKEMPHRKLPLDQFIITLILISIIISFFQIRAKSGIWPALIIHTFVNLTMEVTPLYNEKEHTLWIIANCVLFLTVIILIVLELIENIQKSHTSTN